MDTKYMWIPYIWKPYIYGHHIYRYYIYEYHICGYHIYVPRGNFLLFLFIVLYDSWVLNEIMFYTNVGMQLFWRQ